MIPDRPDVACSHDHHVRAGARPRHRLRLRRSPRPRQPLRLLRRLRASCSAPPISSSTRESGSNSARVATGWATRTTCTCATRAACALSSTPAAIATTSPTGNRCGSIRSSARSTSTSTVRSPTPSRSRFRPSPGRPQRRGDARADRLHRLITMDATHTGPLEAGKAWLRERVERGLHPSTDSIRRRHSRRSSGSPAWNPSRGRRRGERSPRADAAQARAAAEATQRHHLWEQAYQAAFLGRYPVPNHPLKAKLYERGRGYFLEAAALEQPPARGRRCPVRGPPRRRRQRPLLPHASRRRGAPAGCARVGRHRHLEGGDARPAWGAAALRGLAVVLIDMPGVGESPVLASADAERQWTPIFDYLATRDRPRRRPDAA